MILAGAIHIVQLAAVGTPEAAFAAGQSGGEPTILITAPADGATYGQRTWQRAQYACAAGATPVTSCTATLDATTPVEAGAAFGTQTLGSHQFQVRAVDSAGRIAIRTLTYAIAETTGTGPLIRSVAGGLGGDGGLATGAAIDPSGVAVDVAGNVYIAEPTNHRVRKVAAGTGIITTIAGTGDRGFAGDGGPATTARLAEPTGLAVGGGGDLYIADTGNNRVRVVSAATGKITTFAGSGSSFDIGDGGPAGEASLWWPSAVALDGAGVQFFFATSEVLTIE